MNYVRNILEVFEQASSDEITHGLTWYKYAKNHCQTIADLHELPLKVVVGVCAALSPTNKWERNLTDAETMCSIFVNGGYVEECRPCTYKTMRDKAWSILEAMPDNDGDILEILNGAKISDFYCCIMGQDKCVIDGHAWCIANNDRRTMQEVPNIGKRLRLELQEAYSAAAAKKGLTAYEMQAITWVTWKRIYGV